MFNTITYHFNNLSSVIKEIKSLTQTVKTNKLPDEYSHKILALTFDHKDSKYKIDAIYKNSNMKCNIKITARNENYDKIIIERIDKNLFSFLEMDYETYKRRSKEEANTNYINF